MGLRRKKHRRRRLESNSFPWIPWGSLSYLKKAAWVGHWNCLCMWKTFQSVVVFFRVFCSVIHCLLAVSWYICAVFMLPCCAESVHCQAEKFSSSPSSSYWSTFQTRVSSSAISLSYLPARLKIPLPPDLYSHSRVFNNISLFLSLHRQSTWHFTE